MSAPHIIRGHAAMSAQELGLSPSIVTKYCDAPTNRQRLRAYQQRLDMFEEGAPPQAELVTLNKAITTLHVAVGELTDEVLSEAKTTAGNISAFLRKGGAK